MPGVDVFHAGTARAATTIVTAGGRVLTVVGRGRDVSSDAIARAYEACRRSRSKACTTAATSARKRCSTTAGVES